MRINDSKQTMKNLNPTDHGPDVARRVGLASEII